VETSTHILIGIGLGSLSSLDPALLSDPLPVYLSCVLASNAPDFDFAAKLKGNSVYYKLHRGFSHSLPMLPLWAFLITAGFIPFTQNIEFLNHLFIWNLVAVTIHVLTDSFNIHGTQALRPFTKKWISLDFVPLFDFFIFFLHSVGFISCRLSSWQNVPRNLSCPFCIFITAFCCPIVHISSTNHSIYFFQENKDHSKHGSIFLAGNH
jgi:inner membrane protein